MADGIAALPDTQDRILAQVDRLVGDDDVRAATWVPIANNFVLMLFPRHRDVRADLDAIGSETAHLNDADLLLLEHCEAIATANPALGERVSDDLRSWREVLERGANLLGSDHAIRVLTTFRDGPDLHDEIVRGRADIVDAFRYVPETLRTLVRIGAHLPIASTPDAVAALARSSGGGVIERVSRIEVAKALDPRFDAIPPPFPSLIVYLGVDPADRPDAATIASTMEAVRDVCRQVLGTAVTRRVEYSVPIGPVTHLTQGFRLHKRYLERFGVLSEEFDQRTGHALTRRDRCDDIAFADAVRDALRACAPGGATAGLPSP